MSLSELLAEENEGNMEHTKRFKDGYMSENPGALASFCSDLEAGSTQEFDTLINSNFSIDTGKFKLEELLYHAQSPTYPLVMVLEPDKEEYAKQNPGIDLTSIADCQCTHLTFIRNMSSVDKGLALKVVKQSISVSDEKCLRN